MSLRLLFPRLAVLAVVCVGCQERKSSGEGGAAPADSVATNAAAVATAANAGFVMPASQSGQLTLVDAEVFFKPCGSAVAPRRLQDGTKGEVIKLLRSAKGSAGGFVALVRLNGDTLVQVRYATTEQRTCQQLPMRSTLEANGNEPFWAARIEGDMVTYRTPYDPQGIVYQDGKWTRLDGGSWRYVARRAGKGGGELAIELTETRCADTMIQAVFPFVAKLTRSDSTFTGCAVEGNGTYAITADSTRAAARSANAAPTRSSLSGTAWRLAEVNGEPAVDKVKATLEFARGGKVAGNGSCNRFSGSVELKGDSIKFGPLVSTRMACAEAAMRQESAYFKALGDAQRYTREGNTMFIHVKGGAKPLRFEPY